MTNHHNAEPSGCHTPGHGMSRRAVLAGASTAVATAGLAPLLPTGSAQALADTRALGRVRETRPGGRIVVLGSAGGPTTWADTQTDVRHGTASAVVVDGAVYVVDCGQGVGRQLKLAGVGPAGYGHGYDALRAVFLTHLHSDHVVDYFNLMLYGWSTGLREVEQPVQVHGPGDRGALPPLFGSGPEPTVVSPESPTPGTVEMTEHLYAAFATDINDRMRDSNKPDLHGLVRAHDIALPELKGFRSPNETPHPDMEPFKVYEDARVRVSATLVSHAPVFPAFGFRFDTDYGSVVFSGDTAPSGNLVRMARNCDVLVHEVIDMQWVRSLFPDHPSPAQQALINHLGSAHTPIEDVGRIAARAGAGTLVLNHLVPGDNPVHRWKRARRSFGGTFLVGRDLMELPLPGRRSRSRTA